MEEDKKVNLPVPQSLVLGSSFYSLCMSIQGHEYFPSTREQRKYFQDEVSSSARHG